MSADGFTHLTAEGNVHMVDVTEKAPSVRSAVAQATVIVSSEVMLRLSEETMPKGDVWASARIAGIAATKKCADLIPLAHPIGVHGAEVDITMSAQGITIRSTVRTADRTGVEMEALTSAAVAGLTIIDMVKGLDRFAHLSKVQLIEKHGGRSGSWIRPDEG